MFTLYHTCNRHFSFPTQMNGFIYKYGLHQMGSLLKLLEKMYCKSQKQNIFTFEMVPVNAAINCFQYNFSNVSCACEVLLKVEELEIY